MARVLRITDQQYVREAQMRRSGWPEELVRELLWYIEDGTKRYDEIAWATGIPVRTVEVEYELWIAAFDPEDEAEPVDPVAEQQRIFDLQEQQGLGVWEEPTEAEPE